ncbi:MULTISPECIES: helix-turn-helix domain-containing protein [Rhizobium]|uniref:AraC family transcriptional regulator n=1 Tax=Rhizobium esperanzae TaxID=1967781 RepID=A0A7W6UKL9_9HYPH|nr:MULTISPECIES: AraC family transcriptional regulator [Rhizobium]MBB4439948.1 AraC family transcriptional regulator [Rhizobium esperanzae]MDH6202485.1 AraC family transcriptional regulator [Rhizobium leguminosarum]OAV54467.1 transcriptional regulator [Rhizobium sp. WYCCWR10014]
MSSPVYSSFAQWYAEGHLAPYVHTMRSPGGVLNLLEAVQPAGDMSDPAVPDFVLYQCLLGGNRVSGDLGWGRFDVLSETGSFFPAAPDFANKVMVETPHRLRSLSFPIVQWQSALDEATDGKFSFNRLGIGGGTFSSPAIRSALRGLWALSDSEGAPSRLLARAAGCEILAELYRLGGGPLKPPKGGLAPWAERRSLEFMRARLSEDVSLDELAAEAQLSTFHFSRMFKQSLGVPPRVYLTRMRMEKACELLAQTELSITDVALEVGYSSNQVLTRVFSRVHKMTPTDYRRAVRSSNSEPLIR